MYINQEKCISCGRCIPYCPRAAILNNNGATTIDMELCVECGVCERFAKCPKEAIYNVHLEAPRAYRKAFSDPFGKHENTALKHAGRGTEEVKTNDVTGVVSSLDPVSFAIEMGRPSVGSTFADLEKLTMTVAPFAIDFEVNNPTTALIIDKKAGKIDPSVLGESIMSAIIEFSCPVKNIKPMLVEIEKASKQIDTVFSMCIICRVDEETNTIPARAIIDELGIDVDQTSAKTNMGLGRPRYENRIKEGA